MTAPTVFRFLVEIYEVQFERRQRIAGSVESDVGGARLAQFVLHFGAQSRVATSLLRSTHCGMRGSPWVGPLFGLLIVP